MLEDEFRQHTRMASKTLVLRGLVTSLVFVTFLSSTCSALDLETSTDGKIVFESGVRLQANDNKPTDSRIASTGAGHFPSYGGERNINPSHGSSDPATQYNHNTQTHASNKQDGSHPYTFERPPSLEHSSAKVPKNTIPSYTFVQPGNQPPFTPPQYHDSKPPQGVHLSSPDTTFEFVKPMTSESHPDSDSNYAVVQTITLSPIRPLHHYKLTHSTPADNNAQRQTQPWSLTPVYQRPPEKEQAPEDPPSFHLERPAARPPVAHVPLSSAGSTQVVSQGDSASTSVGADDKCPCVADMHCPHLSTRIVTPDAAPCMRSGDVRCCFPPGPKARCGTRPNITLQDIALRPGQSGFAHYPWSAVLLSADNEFLGGGALLDDSHVLTAAHKVAHYTGEAAKVAGLKVRLGEWDAAADTEPYSHVEVPIELITVHPDFSAKNLHGDIAVVRLEKPVSLQYTPHVVPVCLPRQDAQFEGHRCWVSGWGQHAFGASGEYQRVMKHVDVPVVTPDECEQRLRNTKLSQFFQLDRRSFICAGGEPQKDACTGDGGSPLVCEDVTRSQFYVVGLVAWGIGCATPHVPGVYVNVAGYSNWIIDNTVNFRT